MVALEMGKEKRVKGKGIIQDQRLKNKDQRREPVASSNSFILYPLAFTL